MKLPLALGCLAVLVLAACGGSAHRGRPAPTTTRAALPPSKSYLANLRFARCMRAHGVAHPNPDANGDFELTPAQERRMRASATRSQREAADKYCFRYLKGVVSTRPLSTPGGRPSALFAT
jgi:hypothetical protein